jgi:hypothetical protein
MDFLANFFVALFSKSVFLVHNSSEFWAETAKNRRHKESVKKNRFL